MQINLIPGAVGQKKHFEATFQNSCRVKPPRVFAAPVFARNGPETALIAGLPATVARNI